MILSAKEIFKRITQAEAHIEKAAKLLNTLTADIKKGVGVQTVRVEEDATGSTFNRYSVKFKGNIIVSGELKKRLFKRIIEFEAESLFSQELIHRYGPAKVKYTPTIGLVVNDPGEYARFEELKARSVDGKKLFVFIGWRDKRSGSRYVHKSPEDAPGNFYFLQRLLESYGYIIEKL